MEEVKQPYSLFAQNAEAVRRAVCVLVFSYRPRPRHFACVAPTDAKASEATLKSALLTVCQQTQPSCLRVATFE